MTLKAGGNQGSAAPDTRFEADCFQHNEAAGHKSRRTYTSSNSRFDHAIKHAEKFPLQLLFI